MFSVFPFVSVFNCVLFIFSFLFYCVFSKSEETALFCGRSFILSMPVYLLSIVGGVMQGKAFCLVCVW